MLIAGVLPDLPAVERVFDYLVPDAVRDQVRVGTMVRVDLHGRRVRGWVVRLSPSASDGVAVDRLKPVAKVSSAGPPAPIVDLAQWAAGRWAGRWVHLLRTASPAANVPPNANVQSNRGLSASDSTASSGSGSGSGFGVEVVRLAPAVDRWALVRDAVAAGPALVVVPAIDTAARLAVRLRRDGKRVALLAGEVRPGDFALAASGEASVVGTRIAVWAPVPDDALTSIVVVDEHDEALQAEQAPTWHARDVAVERARRAGVPCRLVSPVPTLHALALAATGGGAVTAAPDESRGWPAVVIADRRDEDPVKAGLFSPQLAQALRGTDRVVCVLNRLGRSRLLACTACGQVGECERCGAAVTQLADAGILRCGHCGTDRPVVCTACGGGRFKNLRAGVSRVREELEALVGEAVVEVTATEGDPSATRVAVGTEAVLHRLPAASVGTVAFLDLDQELLAPRYRAAEQALALLARAARAVGGRRAGRAGRSPTAAGGKLLLQTRLPDHPVVQAALHGDPDRVVAAERPRRQALRYPPYAALAVVTGAGAPDWVSMAPDVLDIEVLDSGSGSWLVRAPDPDALADYLALVPRPPARLRIEVDPPRL